MADGGFAEERPINEVDICYCAGFTMQSRGEVEGRWGVEEGGTLAAYGRVGSRRMGWKGHG